VRRLLPVVCTIVFVDAALFGAIIPLVPGYADEFDLGKFQAGLLVGAYGAGALAGGIPGGLLARRVGPRNAVVVGLLALAAASFAFALAGGPLALGLSRFVQGLSSALTWTGALAWVTVTGPRARRGQVLGTVFAFAVLGFIVGPMFGALAKLAGIRPSFAIVGVGALLLAGAVSLTAAARAERLEPGGFRRALADPAFVAGLWLNTLPAFLFGMLDVLAPLALDDAGFGVLAIAAVFVAAGLVETVVNPLVGRLSDRRGRLLPIRISLAASVVVGVALAVAEEPLVLAALVIAAAIAFGGFYTPGMALVADRAELAGLAQGLGFGVMNSAWALGALAGPAVGGALADGLGDAAPYLLGALLSAATLAVLAAHAVRPRTA
jgi:MFS family permease